MYPNILSKNKQQQTDQGRETTLILPKVRKSAARTRKKTHKDRPKSRKRSGNQIMISGMAIRFSKTEQTTMILNFTTDCSGRHEKNFLNFQIPK